MSNSVVSPEIKSGGTEVAAVGPAPSLIKETFSPSSPQIPDSFRILLGALASSEQVDSYIVKPMPVFGGKSIVEMVQCASLEELKKMVDLVTLRVKVATEWCPVDQIPTSEVVLADLIKFRG